MVERIKVSDADKKKHGKHLFGKGHGKFGGRKVGAVNKVPAAMKEAFLAALNAVGEPVWVRETYKVKNKTYVKWKLTETGKGAMVGYFKYCALNHVAETLAFAGKMLPAELNIKANSTSNVNYRIRPEEFDKLSDAELSSLYREAVTAPEDVAEQPGATKH